MPSEKKTGEKIEYFQMETERINTLDLGSDFDDLCEVFARRKEKVKDLKA